MKKLLFALIFIFTAAVLSGCVRNRTRTVMFTENPPSLTTMVVTTTTSPDTFSEYMATYSVSETTDESGRGNPYTVPRPPRVSADTGFKWSGAEQVSRDTAAVFTYVVTGEVTSYTGSSETAAVTEVPESETESTATSVAETAAETESGAVSETALEKAPLDTVLRERPRRDTAFSHEVSADTVYSNTSYTENGGTTNADKYTE